MGLYKRKGSQFYWMTFQVDGRRIFESTKTSNKKLAEKIYAKRQVEIVEGRFFEQQKAKSLTFRDMVQKYMTAYSKQRDPYTIKRLLPFFGDYTLDKITSNLIAEYRNLRLKEVKPATVYQELALLRRMFNVAIKEWEWLKENPVSKISFSVGDKNARDRWLTAEEERRLLLSASPEWLKSIIIFALHTGMRRSEILNLKWEDVDFNRKLIIVTKSKNNQKRAIPMSQTVYKLLKGIKVRDISKVFPVTVEALKDAFKRAVKKAGLKDFHFHDLRHTFATRLVQNGIDISTVKELLGHKTITMTMRYAHHYPESLRHGVEVLDRCYNSVTVDGVNT